MRKGNFVAKVSSFYSLVRKNATSPPLSICRHDGFPRLLIEADMHDYFSGHAVYG